MSNKFTEYKTLDLSSVNKEILKRWKEEKTFEKSIAIREGNKSFVFYEGPPSANGIPGIHHVMARAIKDIFCRFKTLDGFQVKRKAGWDTHGLPVELGVEAALGITKEDIGKKVSVKEYNDHCRKDVMKYTREWEDLTEKMGYWVDMTDPYITYDNRYIESLWYLLSELFKKKLLYKGYSIQPYSPAAGTGLSTHELNQPGCYKDVKDTTIVGQFKVIKDEKSQFLFKLAETDVYLLAWTTTPWTLPSNTALAVGKDITYQLISTFNTYTWQPVSVVIAKDLAGKYFPEKNKDLAFEDYRENDKNIPFRVLQEFKGSELHQIRYEQLIPWVKPEKEAFKVLLGDFVTTEDGTGIVHIAPTFGADDFRVAAQNNIPPIIIKDKNLNTAPLVDKKGRFVPMVDIHPDFVEKFVNKTEYKEFAGRYVKNAYDEKLLENDPTVDIDIAVYLKKDNKAFKIEKQEHPYPHCWRTDKPVLYYPLDSWFIKTTALKERMAELNNTINWKPVSTGQGRFGKWLENLVDWNLSRSRYWGTPLPIWATEDNSEYVCISSVGHLKEEIDKSVEAGFMKSNPLEQHKAGDFSADNYHTFDLHRPFVDDIILVSKSGKKMKREEDLIDVWFDSGAMPYAQMHYPFENQDTFKDFFPADFIAEGVDQTRGWFFTLHAIAVMISDSVAFKNIISNGLLLDKKGNKMSKRLGNSIEPFETIEKYGTDPLRWYMITNAQPWDNLKFDISGLDEVNRKFFGTLHNTYSFFTLYANIDGFTFDQPPVPLSKRPEIDRWIISLLNSLIKEVYENYSDYEPTKAGRAIQYFVTESLSNWYVRLNRKRYWGGEFSEDKLSAYQTLYTCLETVAILASPIAPFYMDRLYTDLNRVTGLHEASSVHLLDFPKWNEDEIDKNLEGKMEIAQKTSSLVLSLRRKQNIKVRQPLNKIIIPIIEAGLKEKFESVKNLILTEVNVKEIEYLTDTSGILVKKIKPNFKVLGPKYGRHMKQLSAMIAELGQDEIQQFENDNKYQLTIDNEIIELSLDDVEIISEDIPGWLVANDGKLTVALDIKITEELREEGIAREFVNRIQNLRKDNGFDVTDKITIEIVKNDAINDAVTKHGEYIGSQTLAKQIQLVEAVNNNGFRTIEIDEDISVKMKLTRLE